MLILIAVKGPDRGTVFELAEDQSHLIGRQSETVRMRDRKLSRRHADIYFSAGAWHIRDVGSTNGTRVNARRIETATKLKDGDRIQLGRTIFVVGRLDPDAQPMHATGAPELDAAMRLHDSEHDFQYVPDDAAEAPDRLAAQDQRESSASHHDALADSSEAAARSSAGSRAQRTEAGQRSRSRTSRRTERSAERPMRLTNGPIHPKFASVPPSNARAIWALAAGLVIAIGLLGTLHLRLSEQARSLQTLTPELALQEQQRLNERLMAETQATQERVERIASLIQSQNEQQTESLSQLQEAVVTASATQATANEALVGKVLEELHRLPHATGDEMAQRVTQEVRSVLQGQPKPIDDAVMQEVLAELRRRPVEASNNMASQVIQAMRSHAQEQTDALLAAITDQPRNDTADVVKQVLAELRAEPQADTAALAQEFAAAVEAQTSRQTAALLEQMHKSLAENRPADDTAMRELIAALREQAPPPAAELAQQVAAAVEKEYREHNEAMIKELRTALATASEQAQQAAPTQPPVDTEALVTRIAGALQAQTETFRDSLVTEMRVALASQPQPVSEQAVNQLLVRVQAQAAEHNQAVLAQLREQLQLENQALLEELLASLQRAGDGRLADASGSRLLSHMRQISPGPVSIDRQRAQQHETFALRQLGPVSTDAPRSGAALLAAAELFNPEVPGEGEASPLPPNAVSSEPPKVGEEIRTATGLRFVITQAGEGEAAESGDTVLVHYTGYLADGTVFDSSRTRNKPFGFQLGAGAVIKGWEEGVLGMKQGEKRTLTIPADLAYGSRGAGRSIPPNADLTFEMELLTVIKASETAAR